MVRTKNRWILFRVVQAPTLEAGNVVFHHQDFGSEKILQRAIMNAVSVNYGPFGRGMLRGLYMRYFNGKTGIGIIRVPRDTATMVLSSMFFVKKIDDVSCHFEVLHVSGTIIHLQFDILKRNREFYLRECAAAEEKGIKTYPLTENLEKSNAEIMACLSKPED